MSALPDAAAFWDKTEAPASLGDCRRWLGAMHPDGYGLATMAGSQRAIGVHRIAWELTNGPIPDGLWVLHTCDNRRCVNVAHLYLGTRSDNQRDMAARGRARNGTTKFTLGPVVRIR